MANNGMYEVDLRIRLGKSRSHRLPVSIWVEPGGCWCLRRRKGAGQCAKSGCQHKVAALATAKISPPSHTSGAKAAEQRKSSAAGDEHCQALGAGRGFVEGGGQEQSGAGGGRWRLGPSLLCGLQQLGGGALLALGASSVTLHLSINYHACSLCAFLRATTHQLPYGPMLV